MPAKSSSGRAQGREIPQIVVVLAFVLLVAALGAGGFYAYNGGWQTASQQDEKYKHEILPIMAAKHGDTEALEAENKLRRSRGQAPLEMPKDKKAVQGDYRDQLADLQKKLGAAQGPSGQ